METCLLPANAEGVRRAAELLQAGEVVGIPTETVYGLAADAFNPQAVEKFARQHTAQRSRLSTSGSDCGGLNP